MVSSSISRLLKVCVFGHIYLRRCFDMRAYVQRSSETHWRDATPRLCSAQFCYRQNHVTSSGFLSTRLVRTYTKLGSKNNAGTTFEKVNVIKVSPSEEKNKRARWTTQLEPHQWLSYKLYNMKQFTSFS